LFLDSQDRLNLLRRNIFKAPIIRPGEIICFTFCALSLGPGAPSFRVTRQFSLANDKPGDFTMNKMSKRIAISVASVLIAASMIQTASAGERIKKHHVAATTNEQVRNANASAVPFYGNTGELGSMRDEALSAPAGH
jgi:hypothetical protein